MDGSARNVASVRELGDRKWGMTRAQKEDILSANVELSPKKNWEMERQCFWDVDRREFRLNTYYSVFRQLI